MEKTVTIIPIAFAKLRKRGLTEQDVRQAIAQPEQVVRGYGGRLVAHRRIRIGDKMFLLRVVYEDTPQERVVITAYATPDIERYWEG